MNWEEGIDSELVIDRDEVRQKLAMLLGLGPGISETSLAILSFCF